MEGRSEPQSLTPDPVDPVDPLDPVVNSEWRVLGMKNNEHEKCHSSASLGSVMWSSELCCDSNEVTKSPNEHLCGETMLCPQTRCVVKVWSQIKHGTINNCICARSDLLMREREIYIYIYMYIRKSRPEPIGVRGCAGGGDARGSPLSKIAAWWVEGW